MTDCGPAVRERWSAWHISRSLCSLRRARQIARWSSSSRSAKQRSQFRLFLLHAVDPCCSLPEHVWVCYNMEDRLILTALCNADQRAHTAAKQGPCCAQFARATGAAGGRASSKAAESHCLPAIVDQSSTGQASIPAKAASGAVQASTAAGATGLGRSSQQQSCAIIHSALS